MEQQRACSVRSKPENRIRLVAGYEETTFAVEEQAVRHLIRHRVDYLASAESAVGMDSRSRNAEL